MNQSFDAYQDTNVQTASPAKLRLMLLDRAVEVANLLATAYREKSMPGTNEHSLKLLDLISELLSGIKGSQSDDENELCRQVADLYVFLMQHLLTAQEDSDPTKVDEIRIVLEAEAETWRAVCAQEAIVPPSHLNQGASTGGFNFSA